MNNRGTIVVFEAILIFSVWLLLLLHAWTFSADRVTLGTEQRNTHELEQRLIEWSNSLVLTHHPTHAWKGCATFSEEKRRAISHRIPSSCLDAWKNIPPEEEWIYRIQTRNQNQLTIYYEKENPPLTCIGIQRPIHLDEEPALLEVTGCA